MFLISFCFLVTSLVFILSYWRYDVVMQDIPALMLRRVGDVELRAKVEEAMAANNPDEARMYLRIGQTFGYGVSPDEYRERLEAMETPWEVAKRSVGNFADGFVEGQGESSAGVAGAMTADFTVVGDVRDLYEQFDLYQQEKPVDNVIVTLAGVGVALTAATVVSAGSAAAAKSGSSALKMAARGGRITPRMRRLLMRQGSEVFDYHKFMLATRGERSLGAIRRAAVNAYNPAAARALSETAERVNNIRRSTSLVATVDMLRYVESADDLRRLEKVSGTYGDMTRGILRLTGKTAIGTVRLLRRSTELIWSMLAGVASVIATVLSLAGLLQRRKVA
ncbi:MAG TPA: hypothetical protein PLB10_10415 [Thiolinea sp.]|nr:hypothetical protein [Thiolinea sp.]